MATNFLGPESRISIKLEDSSEEKGVLLNTIACELEDKGWYGIWVRVEGSTEILTAYKRR